MGVLDWLKKKMEEDIAGERNFAKEAEDEHQAFVRKMEADMKRREDEHQAFVRKMEEDMKKREEKMEEKLQALEQLRSVRIPELKQAFEASGRKHNIAEPDEVETLLTLTEKKIIQQCRRPKCHGCKLGWICPKFWSE